MHNSNCTVLVADDDRYVRDDLAHLLSDCGYNLLFSATGQETWNVVSEHQPDLVLLDLRFPDCSDLSLLQRIRRESPETSIIMLTSQTENISQIVAAIKLGAYDYIGKPFVPEELKNRIERALELRNVTSSQKRLLKEAQDRTGLDCLVGDSVEMKAVRETICRFADLDGCVLVTGESGSGKELVARALHYAGRRRANPFVSINCASIPEALLDSVLFGHKRGAFTGAVENTKGKFEIAEDGTIFLDEIGDMPLAQQPALLRVLEYRTFSSVGDNKEKQCRARFVLATNRDLKKRVQEGQFREDLYYRINVARIALPTLTSRPADIPALLSYYIEKLSQEMGRPTLTVTSEAVDLLQKYDWPGNVRELKHVLEGAMMLLDPAQRDLTVRDLPAEVLVTTTAGQPLPVKDQREKDDLVMALKQCNGNQTQVAKLLGVHRNTIRTRIRQYGL